MRNIPGPAHYFASSLCLGPGTVSQTKDHPLRGSVFGQARRIRLYYYCLGQTECRVLTDRGRQTDRQAGRQADGDTERAGRTEGGREGDRPAPRAVRTEGVSAGPCGPAGVGDAPHPLRRCSRPGTPAVRLWWRVEPTLVRRAGGWNPHLYV